MRQSWQRNAHVNFLAVRLLTNCFDAAKDTIPATCGNLNGETQIPSPLAEHSRTLSQAMIDQTDVRPTQFYSGRETSEPIALGAQVSGLLLRASLFWALPLALWRLRQHTGDMVTPGRLELPAYGLGNRRSILLSYGVAQELASGELLHHLPRFCQIARISRFNLLVFPL